MKSFKILTGTLLVFSILSCGSNKDGDLVVEPIGSTAFLIGAAAQSCSNIVAIDKKPETDATMDVAASHFSFQGMTLKWNNTEDTAYILAIDFEFNASALSFKCTVSPDEVLATFYDFAALSNKAWDGSLAPGASRTAGCRIKCGGISVDSGASPFVATGTMTVRGFQRAPNGDEKPIKASAPVRLYYQ